MRANRLSVQSVTWLWICACAVAVWMVHGAAGAQVPADKPVVYNHITYAGAAMDQLVHQTYDAEFSIIDFSDADGAYAPPHLKTGSLPRVPFDERGAPVEGQVVVFYIVTSEGRAIKPVVVRSTDERLNQRVIEAMTDWAFDPAQVRGKFASTTAAQEFDLKAATKR